MKLAPDEYHAHYPASELPKDVRLCGLLEAARERGIDLASGDKIPPAIYAYLKSEGLIIRM